MLMPKRVKRRKVSRGRMKGKANKGNKIAYGEIALVAEECGWVTHQLLGARFRGRYGTLTHSFFRLF